jgi:hypothetical protein
LGSNKEAHLGKDARGAIINSTSNDRDPVSPFSETNGKKRECDDSFAIVTQRSVQALRNGANDKEHERLFQFIR